MTPFFMAWGMFWIVPCPVKKWDSKKFKEMLLCMPFIGLLIGAVWFLIILGLNKLGGIWKIPSSLESAIIFLVPWVLSGFIHLDGFMDCADAVLSRRDRMERVRILKDSTVGAFAVICMVILGILSYAVCSSVDVVSHAGLFIFIPAVSRCVSVFSILMLKPLEKSSYVKMHEEGVSIGYKVIALVILALLIVGAFIWLGKPAICLVVEALCTFLAVIRLRHNLGGMNGDISGCAITIGELCALIAMLVF